MSSPTFLWRTPGLTALTTLHGAEGKPLTSVIESLGQTPGGNYVLDGPS